jgi:3-oxoacyl-(acyl-carrier-protein) synthase
MTVAAMSWVTPLGNDVESVWQSLLGGETAPIETLTNEQTGKRYLVHRVPAELTASLPPHPRLRRASAISRFAAAAGLAALKDAKLEPDRLALVFAISNGGVIYTRRFYSEIVKTGAQAASPLLFPETVFNAPASHLAAILGITGASYTVVGDGAVGILALKLAEDLLVSSDLDGCLVVGAEEIDPLVCEAYRQWRLLRNPRQSANRTNSSRGEPQSQRGMIVSEGAGAALLRKTDGDFEIEKIDPGANFFRRAQAREKLRRVVQCLQGKFSFCIGSANGTFIDEAERSAIGELPSYSPKFALGDSIGASVLWQLIAAAQALRTNQLPTFRSGVSMTAPRTSQRQVSGQRPPLQDSKLPTGASELRALVLACGLNQQLGGLTLRAL